MARSAHDVEPEVRFRCWVQTILRAGFRSPRSRVFHSQTTRSHTGIRYYPELSNRSEFTITLNFKTYQVAQNSGKRTCFFLKVTSDRTRTCDCSLINPSLNHSTTTLLVAETSVFKHNRINALVPNRAVNLYNGSLRNNFRQSIEKVCHQTSTQS